MVLSIRLPVSPSHSDLPRMDDGRNCKNGGNISTHHTCNWQHHFHRAELLEVKITGLRNAQESDRVGDTLQILKHKLAQA